MKYFVAVWIVAVYLQTCSTHPAEMSKKTVLNEQYQGVLEEMCIPAEVHERDGKRYASFGSAVPIHTCSKEQVMERSQSTHHYTDMFTEEVLAPLEELAYVRLDENTAEKVFINRSKRILITSSDGHLAQWRCAPTFESRNQFLAGTPIVSASGDLLSLVTAKHGHHYAISNTDGFGGYFESTEPWLVVRVGAGQLAYGARAFPSRAALRLHLAALPPPPAPPAPAPAPALLLAPAPRLTLVDRAGRQIAHIILDTVIADDVEYL